MSRIEAPLRGQVFFTDQGYGAKPVVIVSNNTRNRALDEVIVIRITSAPKPSLDSIVPLPAGEPIDGRVLCDDISAVRKSALERYAGGLSRATMNAIDAGLKVALGLGG